MNLNFVSIGATSLLLMTLGVPSATASSPHSIEVVPGTPLQASPVAPVGTSTPPVSGAVHGANCQPFLDSGGPVGTDWPLYHNGSGDLALSWTLPDADNGDWITLWLDGGTTGGVEVLPSSDEYAFISVIDSDFDDEPPGYALNPGMHTLWGQLEQNGVLCTHSVTFEAWPPLIDVHADNAPFWEYPTRTEVVTFSQMFKVDEPVTDYYAMHAGLHTAYFGPYSFSFGSTATAGEDFDGPVTTYPNLNPVTFAAGTQETDVEITIIDDLCPERTEYISIHAIYEAQLEWAHVIFWAPEWRLNIIDDDDFRPPCLPDSKF